MAITDGTNPLADLMGDLGGVVERTFRQIDWAEHEIAQAADRHRDAGDVLFHSFVLLTATHELMATEFLFRAHCRELLERVMAGADTRPGTAAEVCCLCHDLSLATPLRSAAIGLYQRMWVAAGLPDNDAFGERLAHHEALHPAAIDDLEHAARRRLAVADRHLRGVTCGGRHHGVSVRCRFTHQT